MQDLECHRGKTVFCINYVIVLMEHVTCVGVKESVRKVLTQNPSMEGSRGVPRCGLEGRNVMDFKQI